MWANYLAPWQGIAYNTKVLPNGVSAWGDVWDAKYKARIILPSLQNTEGLANLFMASHLATGRPMSEAIRDTDAGGSSSVHCLPTHWNARRRALRSTLPLPRKASSPARRESVSSREPRRLTSPSPMSTNCSAPRSRRRYPPDLCAADQPIRAAARRHANQRHGAQRRLGLRCGKPGRVGQALGPGDGDLMHCKTRTGQALHADGWDAGHGRARGRAGCIGLSETRSRGCPISCASPGR
jgi:hypothetical protein